MVHAIRWMQYLGTLLALGAVAFRFGVVSTLQRQSALGPAAALMLGRLVGLAGAGALFLAVSLPGRLWSQSVATWGSDALGAGNLGTLIFRTPWGWGWLLQLAAVIVLLLGVRFTAPGGTRKVGWYILAAGGLMAAFVPSFSGHAWGIEPLLLGVLVSAGHSVGASIWMGALAALLLAGLPGIRAVRAPDGSLPGLGALVNAFSRIALPAVVLVVLTGAVQNFFLLGGLGNVFSTGWGRTLLVKLGLVVGAMALGLYNWRVVRPALETTPRAGLLRIPATVEFVLGLCVLAATAVLVSRALP